MLEKVPDQLPGKIPTKLWEGSGWSWIRMSHKQPTSSPRCSMSCFQRALRWPITGATVSVIWWPQSLGTASTWAVGTVWPSNSLQETWNHWRNACAIVVLRIGSTLHMSTYFTFSFIVLVSILVSMEFKPYPPISRDPRANNLTTMDTIWQQLTIDFYSENLRNNPGVTQWFEFFFLVHYAAMAMHLQSHLGSLPFILFVVHISGMKCLNNFRP